MRYINAFPDPQVVLPKLRPVFPTYIDVVEEGIGHANAARVLLAKRNVHLTRKSIGQLVNACVVESAKVRLKENAHGCPGMALFRTDDTVFAFKISKNRRRAIAQNHQSDQQDRLRRLKRAEKLLPFDVADFVMIVYKLDPTMTSLAEVYVACAKGYDENKWAHEFLGEVRGSIHSLPFETKAPEKAKIAPRTKIRRKKRQSGDGDSAS